MLCRCGAEFPIKNAHYIKGKIYCSKECPQALIYKKEIEKQKPSHGKTIKCICGKDWPLSKAFSIYGEKFCSSACSGIYKKEEDLKRKPSNNDKIFRGSFDCGGALA